MRCTSVAVVLLGAWFLMIPPETVNWHCARVQHDEAPVEQWTPLFRFETQEACQAFRSELVRRESNPRRRERARAYMAEMDRRYRQNTPLYGRVLDYLLLCAPGGWQPLDFFGHTRCACREQGTP